MKASMPLTHQYLLNIVEEAGGLMKNGWPGFIRDTLSLNKSNTRPSLPA